MAKFIVKYRAVVHGWKEIEAETEKDAEFQFCDINGDLVLHEATSETGGLAGCEWDIDVTGVEPSTAPEPEKVG